MRIFSVPTHSVPSYLQVNNKKSLMKRNTSFGWKWKGVYLLISLFFLCSFPRALHAQTNANHLLAGGGISYRNGVDATIGFEHTTSYHNAWEYFANGYVQYGKDSETGTITNRSFFHNYHTWMFGVAYKPCVIRGRNHHGNIRIGGMAGSDTEKFVGGGSVGYEHSYTLHNDWEVFFLVKEDVVARGEDLFRTGLSVGVKIPLN